LHDVCRTIGVFSPMVDVYRSLFMEQRDKKAKRRCQLKKHHTLLVGIALLDA
jgi:hypothetical protein